MNGSETKGSRRRSALGKDSGEKQGEREPGRTWSLISTAEGCVLGPWKGSEMTDVSDFGTRCVAVTLNEMGNDAEEEEGWAMSSVWDGRIPRLIVNPNLTVYNVY